MPKTEPRGYWTRVFDQATALLQARPELNGDSAYWLARRMVDQALIQEQIATLPAKPCPTCKGEKKIMLGEPEGRHEWVPCPQCQADENSKLDAAVARASEVLGWMVSHKIDELFRCSECGWTGPDAPASFPGHEDNDECACPKCGYHPLGDVDGTVVALEALDALQEAHKPRSGT